MATEHTTILGFTGTSEGLTLAQKRGLYTVVREFHPREVHHGDCVGADDYFHDVIRSYFPDCKRIIHPPDNPKKRAFCGESPNDIILPEKPYLARNQDIVNAAKVLIACPKEFKEVVRSGTWSTVRRAAKRNIPIYILLPDGKLETRYNDQKKGFDIF